MKTIVTIIILSIISIWYIDWDTLNKECKITYGNVCATEKTTAEMQKAIEMQRQKEINRSMELYGTDIYYR